MVEIMSSASSSSDQKAPPKRVNTCFHHVGYLVVGLGGLVVGAMYFARVFISVTMMSMVNRTHLYMMEHPNFTMEELELKVDRKEDGEFNWSNELQQMIIGSYMITYTLPQIFVGRLCLRYGFRLSAFVGLLTMGVSNLLVPSMVYLDWKWALALRMLNGLGSTGSISCVLMAVEKWLPIDSAQLGLSIMQFVVTVLIFICPLVAGLVSQVHWQWGFYTAGLMSISVGILWFVCVREEPSDCYLVSQIELDTLKNGKRIKGTDGKTNSKAKELSWYFMFKLKNFYVFTFVWTCYCMAEAVIFVSPIYFKKAFQLNTKDNGIYNFITQIGIVFSCIWPNPVISLLQNHFKMSLTAARNIIVSITSSIAALTCLYVALYHDTQLIMLGLYRFSHMSNDLMILSCMMSQYGPHGLSGPVFSTANTIAMFMQAVFCWAIGRFLDYSGESYASWSWTIGSFGALNAAIFIVYAVFLKSEPVRIRELESENAEKGGCKEVC